MLFLLSLLVSYPQGAGSWCTYPASNHPFAVGIVQLIHPELIGCLVLLVLLAYLTAELVAEAHHVPLASSFRRKWTALGGAFFLLWVAAGSPLHLLSGYLLSALVLVELIVAFGVAPLLLHVLPNRLVFTEKWPVDWNRWLTWLAMALFEGYLFALRTPFVVNAQLIDAHVHFGSLDLLLLLSLFLGWCMQRLRQTKDTGRCEHVVILGCLLVATVLVGSLPLLGQRPLYAAYLYAPRLGPFSLVADQHLAAIVHAAGSILFVLTMLLWRSRGVRKTHLHVPLPKR
ncbi:MAG: hypothetical protein IMW91_09365 [Firmicutes bacterium]|nr:hypothetical protein [Bacillota bacterium]